MVILYPVSRLPASSLWFPSGPEQTARGRHIMGLKMLFIGKESEQEIRNKNAKLRIGVK